MRRLLAIAVLLLLPRIAHAEALTVFAAASLTDAMKDIAASWEKQGHPPLRLAFGASSTLARQIEQGAPVNLFASADEQWMDYLAGRGLIASGARRDLLANRLVLVVPADQPQRVTIGPGFDLAGLLGKDGRLATGDPAHVPVGIYARQALNRLGRLGHRAVSAGAYRRCARRAAVGGAWRGTGGHCLCHGRRRLTRRRGRRRFS